MVERSLVPLFDEPQRDARMDKSFKISVKNFVVVCIFLYATALLNGVGVGYVFFSHRSASEAVVVDSLRTSGPSAPRSSPPASFSRPIPPPSVPTVLSSPSGADSRMPIASMSNRRSYNPHLSGRSFESGGAAKSLTSTGDATVGMPPIATPVPSGVEHHSESRATEPPATALHEATTSIYDWREKSVGK